MILTLDFETYDPYIDRDLGSGWVYGINVPNSDFRILGCAVKFEQDGNMHSKYYGSYGQTKVCLQNLVDRANTLVMHNASYDLGCLTYLGIDYSHCKIYDTMVAGKLYDSSLMSHSLDNLANRYLGHQKDNEGLAKAALDAGIYPHTKKYLEELGKGLTPALDMKKVIKWCKAHMDIVSEHCPDAVDTYARIDVDLTRSLYDFYHKELEDNLVTKYSSLAKVCNSYRQRGVRIDLEAARSALQFLNIEIVKSMDHLYNIAGRQFNISSPKEVTDLLHELGLNCPKTAKGAYSATSPWLESQSHPATEAIIEARKLLKIKNDFILKIIDMQEYTCPGADRYGRIYPELNLLRASTGRFSCSSPNIQQIPSRDEKLSPLCRAIFVPEEDERLFSLDYSNQEGRLQVHYAYMLECEGATELKLRFDANPNFDMHQAVADQMHTTRKTAKTINLGLSYGMGAGKLAKALGVDVDYARDVLMYNYFKWVPWLIELKKKCEERIKTVGQIRTLGGRFLKNDPPAFVEGKKRTFEYKALNKLIQGSAADQTIEAMIQAYNEGIPVMFPVHDQLLMSGTREQAVRLKEIMENAIPLCIPVVVDVNLEGGESWLKAGH